MPLFPEKYIVPGLEAKARKYSRAMTILFPFCLLILPAIPWVVLSVKASRYTQLLRITHRRRRGEMEQRVGRLLKRAGRKWRRCVAAALLTADHRNRR